ncbi:MAG: LLM class flavin-dependent oxidoreductase [Cyclobacteriaceae bacterium]|jgi:probable LLM family oxidoreductase|nr:LLM class flavin-dependent oxidoreductase [Cyclobacteriaceae bacterium]HQQ98057.1 LLM class flavin-dependent oxidoreductase [Cyclobacteriaceae bacterium]
MEIGLYTFADVAPDRKPGNATNTHQRIKDVLEEIQLADQLGLDVFALGEHHRPDYAVSSPVVLLAAAAAVTRNIKLSSAVTVLSSDDPVRVFQSFATLDQISDGRAEIMVGRGSFIESFPLFGYDLNDYDALFSEKLDLLMKINQHEVVSWKGKMRPPIDHLGVYPRPLQEKLPIWLAVGGTPASAIRAAKLNLPMALAIIGGMPERFVPFVNIYKDAAVQLGRDRASLPLGINTHVYVAQSSQQASDEYYPTYAAMMTRIGRERGWPPLTREQFEANRSPRGYLMVGSVQEVIDKMLMEYELFHHTRFLAQMSVGTVPHKNILKSIELFGTQVVPAVRKAIGQTAR